MLKIDLGYSLQGTKIDFNKRLQISVVMASDAKASDTITVTDVATELVMPVSFTVGYGYFRNIGTEGTITVGVLEGTGSEGIPFSDLDPDDIWFGKLSSSTLYAVLSSGSGGSDTRLFYELFSV